MNNIVPISKSGMVAYADKDLALIRRTVAKDTNDDEFNLFIHTARHLGLDPLRRQIYAFVFSKDDAKKRSMSIVTAIDGFRAIAERTGNYRPDEDEPTIKFDNSMKSPLNPLGIVKASVRVWKFSHGGWHKATGSAFWEEYAPIKDEWAYDQDVGKRKPTGRKLLDDSGKWAQMPRHMVSKVAEALALRKAWPDVFSNVYAVEEMDRARIIDLLPSEAAAEGAKQERLEKIGARDTVPLIFADNGALELVPVGQAADRCFEFIKNNIDEPSAIHLWSDRNKNGLRELWAKAPTDALEVKRKIEEALA
jgi:phage recombination protein Bet